jgi:hypothetical protein
MMLAPLSGAGATPSRPQPAAGESAPPIEAATPAGRRDERGAQVSPRDPRRHVAAFLAQQIAQERGYADAPVDAAAASLAYRAIAGFGRIIAGPMVGLSLRV